MDTVGEKNQNLYTADADVARIQARLIRYMGQPSPPPFFDLASYVALSSATKSFSTSAADNPLASK